MNKEILIAIPIVMLLLAGMAGVGGKLIGSVYSNSALKAFPLSVASGFAVYSYVGYLIALFAAPVSPFLILSLAILSIIIGHSYYQSFFIELRKIRIFSTLKSPLVLVLLMLTAGMLFLESMNWLTPPKEGDALWGYMYTARSLYANGLHFIPYNPRYSLFPFNTELVYSFSFAFGTDLVAKFLDGLLGLCFLLAVYELARRNGVSRLLSFIAAINLSLVPQFVTTWSSGKVDVTACYIFFAGISVLLLNNRWQTLAVSAFLIGTACSQKYTFWILIIPIPIIIALKTTKTQIVKSILLFGIIISICLIPHFIKNIAWADNPIAPFAQDYFNPNIKILPHESDAIKTELKDFPRLPLTLFWGGKPFNGAFPLLILFGIPLYFFAKDTPLPVRLTLLTAALQLLVWIVVRREEWLVERFLIAQFGLFLVAAAYSLDYFAKRYKFVEVFAIAFVIVLISYTGIWNLRHRRESLAFVLGKETRLEWQQRIAPGRAYAALNSINLNENERLMGPSYVYNLPDNKIPFLSTEREYVEFLNTSDEQKVNYLRTNKFRYYLYRGTGNPEMAEDLRVWDSDDTSDNKWIIFEIN